MLADSILDMLTSPDTLKAARDEWTQTLGTSQYFTLLPNDVQPNVETNKATMATFRPAMSRFYCTKRRATNERGIL